MRNVSDFLPLAEAALRRGETREVVLRRVMRHELVGERRADGRWYVKLDPVSSGTSPERAA